MLNVNTYIHIQHKKEHKDILEGMETFRNLIVVMASWVYSHAQNSPRHGHKCVQLKMLT